jgi:hypothetical protein
MKNDPSEVEDAPLPAPIAEGVDTAGEIAAPPATEPAPEPVAETPQAPTPNKNRSEIAARFKETRQNSTEFDGDVNKPENQHGAIARQEPEPEPVPEAPKFKLKVRGQELEVDQDELIRMAQIGAGGESYIKEAKELLDEVKQTRTASPPRQHPGAVESEPEPADEPTAQRQHPGDALVELVDELQTGDPKDVAPKLGKLVSDASRRAMIEDRMNSDKISNDAYLEGVRSKNEDLTNDPDAMRAIQGRIVDKMRSELEGLGLPGDKLEDPGAISRFHSYYRANGVKGVSKFTEIVDTSITGYREKFARTPAPKPANQQRQQPTVTVDRSQRRAAIPNQPTRATAPSAMTTQPAADSRVDRASNVVTKMRAARHQVV